MNSHRRTLIQEKSLLSCIQFFNLVELLNISQQTSQ